jgi:uroporphyrinogen-III decarboxylase
MLAPLDMLNPVAPVFSLGCGTGTLVPSFGVPLDPAAGYAPVRTIPIAELLAQPAPDPLSSGLMPAIAEDIELIRASVPDRFKIGLPDMQGPFNLLHAMAGEDALVAPYVDPERFHAMMSRITTAWVAMRRRLVEKIGPAYRHPGDRLARIAECSCNLVSPEFYREYVLPYDRRIAQAFGPLHIHPCSGPHVFLETLEHLPVAATEAGFVDGATRGSISVEDALLAIGTRPILLHIGQELPEGGEEAFILRDFDRYEDHPWMLFAYTGMHWSRKDRPLIRSMHRRLDDQWPARSRG